MAMVSALSEFQIQAVWSEDAVTIFFPSGLNRPPSRTCAGVFWSSVAIGAPVSLSQTWPVAATVNTRWPSGLKTALRFTFLLADGVFEEFLAGFYVPNPRR